ncbi:hypothetical protein RDABS01_004899 [Bienertia sinuspersici]
MKENIQLNRKVLSELAMHEPYSFKALVDVSRNANPGNKIEPKKVGLASVLALLAKQGTRILNQSDSLLGKTLGRKYGISPAGFFGGKWKLNNGGTWGWKSIKWGLELLEKNCCWIFRDGNQARIGDPWILISKGDSIRKYNSSLPRGGGDLVNTLIQENNRWNEVAIANLFDRITCDSIRSIEVGKDMGGDVIEWCLNKNGNYTVRSGYKAVHSEAVKDKTLDSMRTAVCDKNIPWNLSICMERKIFLCKVMNNAIPTKVNLRTRGVSVDVICDHCSKLGMNEAQETSDHIFRECDLAKHVWRGCRLGIRVDTNQGIPIGQWIKQWLAYLSKQRHQDFNSLSYFIHILIGLWRSRNGEVFEKIPRVPEQIIKSGDQEGSTSLLKGPRYRERAPGIVAGPPGFEKARCKTSAIVSNKICDEATNLFLAGCSRDSRRHKVRLVFSRSADKRLEVTWVWAMDKPQAILKGILWGLEKALQLGIFHLRLNVPSKDLFGRLTRNVARRTEDRTILEKIWIILPYFHCLEAALRIPSTP